MHIDAARLRAVVTPNEVIEADRCVLACGSWSPRVARRLGLRLPLQPGKGYHLDIDRPLYPDHNAMMALIKSCEILEAVEAEVGSLG